MTDKTTYNFDEYIRQGEPDKRQRAENWQIAIGLQAVDGLKPSQYLIETAQRHIEGELDIETVKRRIDEYYKTKEGRKLTEEGTDEAGSYEIVPQTDADPVMRLVQILGKDELSAEELSYKIGLGNRILLLHKYYLTPAIYGGWVRMLYPDSPRHPRQKYLLTVKGLSFYNE